MQNNVTFYTRRQLHWIDFHGHTVLFENPDKKISNKLNWEYGWIMCCVDALLALSHKPLAAMGGGSAETGIVLWDGASTICLHNGIKPFWCPTQLLFVLERKVSNRKGHLFIAHIFTLPAGETTRGPQCWSASHSRLSKLPILLPYSGAATLGVGWEDSDLALRT